MLIDLIRDPAGLATMVAMLGVGAAGGAWAASRWCRRRARPARSTAPADFDRVTGLMSRARFEALMLERLAAAEREGRGICLIYAGLDGFRLVNDNHGHVFGDEVLRRTAEHLRELCGPDMPLCRVAGDEFAILADAPGHSDDALARRLVESFTETLKVGGQAVSVGLSVGIAKAPEHGGGARLLGMAAAAMRSVKRSGGGAHAMFDPQIEAQQREEFTIARELRQAIEKHELELVYQPKIDAQSLQVTAVEALLRWRHPTLGAVSPARFIPIAEKHGLIKAIGNWVLDKALAQAAEWRRAGLRMRVAINVSGYQMRQDEFAARLERGLKAHGLTPGRFTCEITESVAMEDTAVTRNAFSRLGEIGVHVSIDDFGTGHSNLSALRRLPAEELKIDRAFVSDMLHSEEARTIVLTILQMARALKLRVVAEGVETVAQRDLLVMLGCDELQGYLFARPMSARAIGIWASDASKTLTQTFRASLFKETVACHDPHPTRKAAQGGGN
ncbi:MAG: bifunctional diguanylate cyclase/phosphodiesterase [Burkholderiales bacterium]|nr:bifunctional diguanylate cyclase/phosphodiesterase [Burkholderiales bacterium]